MLKYFSVIVLYVLIQTQAYAWNNLGHRVVAQIAYDNMDVKSQRLFRAYNQLLNVKGRKYTLVDSSFWLDTLYSERYKKLRKMHYIDIPLVVGNIKKPKIDTYNAVFAINITNLIMHDKSAPLLDKALSSRMIWHIVGDLHQPMHAVSRYSKRFPNGDKGGNLERLSRNPVAKNLHQYWDRGAGLLHYKKRPNAEEVRNIAKYINNKYPCDKKNANLSPEKWAEESHEIAANFSYKLPANHKYQTISQEIVVQRLAAAGCRLAAMSEKIAVGEKLI